MCWLRSGAADVIAAVKFAAMHNVLTAVRGGGHNIAGSALSDGGLTIDLSNMRSVDVDPAQKTVRVQGGALLADVDHETQAFGLAVPFGINSTTGVAGLTLGGGFGWMSRAFAHAGYPMDVEALLIVEVEGSDAEMDAMLERIIEIARKHGVKTIRESQSATEAALIWKGRKSAFGATGRIADYICMDATDCGSPTCFMQVTATCIR